MDENNVESLEIRCNENATIKVNIMDFIVISLEGFEDFLKYIKKEKGDLVDAIIEEAISQSKDVEDFGVQVEGEFHILQNNPVFYNKIINTLLDLLNYSKYKKKPLNEEIIVDVLDLVKGYILFDYLQAISMLAAMSREEAINLIQKYIKVTIKSRSNSANFIESLKDYVNRLKNTTMMWQTHDGILKMYNDEKIVYKVKKCRWAEVLQDCDKEICYSMMCYQDLFQVKNLNPDFNLTRSKTIMQGDEYCDFCYHDERKVKEIIHPSEKFWNEFK